jgi:hypothetical protein
LEPEAGYPVLHKVATDHPFFQTGHEWLVNHAARTCEVWPAALNEIAKQYLVDCTATQRVKHPHGSFHGRRGIGIDRLIKRNSEKNGTKYIARIARNFSFKNRNRGYRKEMAGK